jgi:hypothetical protein
VTAADRLEGALPAGVDHDVKEYPNGGHSFLDNHDLADVPTLFVAVGKITGGKITTSRRPKTRADASFRSSTRIRSRKPNRPAPRILLSH